MLKKYNNPTADRKKDTDMTNHKINQTLTPHGLNLHKGDGYFYFSTDDENINPPESIYKNSIQEITEDDLNEAIEQHNDNVEELAEYNRRSHGTEKETDSMETNNYAAGQAKQYTTCRIDELTSLIAKLEFERALLVSEGAEYPDVAFIDGMIEDCKNDIATS